MIVDYHLHLRGLPEDGSEPLDFSREAIERFVESAARCGVDEIGFTEHVYYFRQTRDVWHLPYHTERCQDDLDAYCDVVLDAKRLGLPVKLGLEVDYVEGRQDRLGSLLAGYPWDFLLGSVHEVGELAIDDWPGIWESAGVEEIWRGYFAELVQLATGGHVDVMAHPDLAKIYSRRPDREVVAELHESAAEAFAAGGVAVEISTAGLRKPVGEIYPDEGFLAACRRHNVPITLASDAHTAEAVGFEFDRAIELVRRVGYETISTFDARVPRQEPLP